jgi:hypothetical protein
MGFIAGFLVAPLPPRVVRIRRKQCGLCSYSFERKISVKVTGLKGTLVVEDDQGDALTFTANKTLTFANTYKSGAAYTVSVTTQPSTKSCIPTYSSGTITKNIMIDAVCETADRPQDFTRRRIRSLGTRGRAVLRRDSAQQDRGPSRITGYHRGDSEQAMKVVRFGLIGKSGLTGVFLVNGQATSTSQQTRRSLPATFRD